MNIALFLDSFPKISETFILNQVEGLLDSGHQVTIFPRVASGETILHPIVKRRSLLNKTHFPVQSSRAFPMKVLLLARLVIVNLLSRKQVARLRATFDNYRYIPAWRRALAEAEPAIRHGGCFDIVFAHFGPNGVRADWYREAGLLQGPLVTVFHGYDLTQYLRAHGEAIYCTLFRNGDLFLPISRFWQDRLQSLGCPPDKIKVHHVGIDCEQFFYRPRTLTPGQPVTFISVARLVEKKGIEYAIRALAQAVASGVNMRYRLIGDGPLLPTLQRLVADLGLAGQVSFAGVKTSDEVAQELQQAHVFLAPSVTSSNGDKEGIPTVLMEAMATGMPVISTRHSGIPELVEDQVSGRLVDERDVEALAQAIREIARDAAIWGPMGQAGREKVWHEFNSVELNARLERHFEGLLVGARRC